MNDVVKALNTLIDHKYTIILDPDLPKDVAVADFENKLVRFHDFPDNIHLFLSVLVHEASHIHDFETFMGEQLDYSPNLEHSVELLMKSEQKAYLKQFNFLKRYFQHFGWKLRVKFWLELRTMRMLGIREYVEAHSLNYRESITKMLSGGYDETCNCDEE